MLASVKKGKALADVKNTVYLKQNAVKNKQIKPEEHLYKEYAENEPKEYCKASTKKTASVVQVVNDDDDIDIDDCPSCLNNHDEYDWRKCFIASEITVLLFL